MVCNGLYYLSSAGQLPALSRLPHETLNSEETIPSPHVGQSVEADRPLTVRDGWSVFWLPIILSV